MYTDKWRAYNSLVLDGYQHFRIDHSKRQYSNRRGTHINGIENFWSFAIRRLRKLNDIRRADFYFHLKETEWRYNYRSNLEASLKEIVRKF